MSSPEPHFDKVWYVSMANVALLTVLLFLPVPRAVVTHYAVGAFAWFLSAEIAAGGVRAGYSGTKTSWLFHRVEGDTLRVGLGVWMGVLMFLTFPAHWAFRVLAGGFLLWLPKHYTHRGAQGPVDRLARWIGRWTGLDRIL